MKNNIENIPNEVFDHLQKHSFGQLNKQQQEEVLKYITSEEYDEMHLAFAGISSATESILFEGKQKVKDNLLQAFDQKHTAGSSQSFLKRPVVFWKAAAAFIVFTSVFALAYVMKGSTGQSKNIFSVTDTVYVTKEVASTPEKVYDTVYIYKEVKPAKQNADIKETITNSKVTSPVGNMNDLDIITIKEFENSINTTRGNSLKDDSLIRKFAPSTL